MSELLALADRCERSVGPDRELDGKIKLAVAAQLFAAGASKDEAISLLGGDLYDDPLSYTGSLTDSKSLVTEGSEWECGTALLINAAWAAVIRLDGRWKAKAATPELALSAAALRARAAEVRG